MKASRPLSRIPVPLRITAIVLLAILVPSVLITALGLFAVYRAEPMVREKLAEPVVKALDRLSDRLKREWKRRLEETGRKVAAWGDHLGAGWPLDQRPLDQGPVDGPGEVLIYSGGAFQKPRRGDLQPGLEAFPRDPALASARDLEQKDRDHRRALGAYRAVIEDAGPEAVVEALLGAARCHRELGEWQEAVRCLRRVVEGFGETVDGTGVARALPALLRIAETCRDGGDLPGEQLAVRELVSELLLKRRPPLDADQAAFYLGRLKRYPEAVEALAALELRKEAPPAAQSPPPPAPELLEKLRLHAEERGQADAPGYHRVELAAGGAALLAFFRAPQDRLVYLRLDPADYLRDVRLFSREMNLPAERLRITDPHGRQASSSPGLPGGSLSGGPAPHGSGSPLASRTLPVPLSDLTIHYHPAPGEVAEELRSLKTSRVALFTWAIIVLVLTIILGVSLTLRSILREMRVTRLKSDFVGFVTHELKTPLTAIRMFAETLLLERVADAAERRRCVELIDQEAARLTRLIDQILEFSRIERKQKAFEFSSGDMAEVVDEAVRLFLDHNREAGCEIEVNKAQHRISRIKMDRAAMVELLLNLLSNALKYSRDSKKIVVNVRESINDIAVEVIDRGIGIPKREQRKIFEQFYRAQDFLTREVEGTGLGLTFARYIAKVHGGDIKVSSAVNQGSTFTLELRKNQVLAE